VPRSNPDQISVNARCLDGIDVASLKPTHFFDGHNWEAAMARGECAVAVVLTTAWWLGLFSYKHLDGGMVAFDAL
jgi:hypothetical protein